MIVVVDANVALKWFFQDRDNEADCDLALSILNAVDEVRINLMQPPHLIAEVGAVLAREKSDEAKDDLFDLLNIESRFANEPEIYTPAIDLAKRYRATFLIRSITSLHQIPPARHSSPPTQSITKKLKKAVGFCC